MTYILGAICTLMALVLAWRGYRFTAREGHQRKLAAKRRLGR